MPVVDLLLERLPGRSASRRARALHPPAVTDAARAPVASEEVHADWLADRRPPRRGSAAGRFALRHVGGLGALVLLGAVLGGAALVARAQAEERVTLAAQHAALEDAVAEATRRREVAERQSARAEAGRVRTEREREIAVSDALAGQIDAERARAEALRALSAERSSRWLAERRLGEASRALDEVKTVGERPLPDAVGAQEPL